MTMFQNIPLTEGWWAEQMHKELNAMSKETPNNLTLKWSRDINKYVSMEDSGMVNNFINSDQ